MTDVVTTLIGEEALVIIDRRLLIIRMISSFIQTPTFLIWTGGNIICWPPRKVK